MWNQPSREDLAEIPGLYSGEEIHAIDKIIHMHFFIGGCDWYAAEYDPEEEVFFGFAILNNDFECAEWGYFSLAELSGINVNGIEIDRDLHWRVRPAGVVDRIQKAQGWKKQ